MTTSNKDLCKVCIHVELCNYIKSSIDMQDKIKQNICTFFYPKLVKEIIERGKNG